MPAPACFAIEPLTWLPGREGRVAIGASEGFAFDCERPRHDVLLAPHAMASRLVTNREWAEFIADGGYRTATLWLSDGWTWVQNEKVEAPLYWHDDGTMFTLGGRRRDRRRGARRAISHYEADAFARWAGRGCRPRPSGRISPPAPIPGSATSSTRGPCRPAAWRRRLRRRLAMDRPALILPFPGFKTAEGAVGEYNGKFMSGQMVLKGASCATPRGHSRASYRNFFPSSARWQFTGCALLATPSDVDPAFRADVLAGLAEPIPAVPARWLYDRRGSELFDAITRLPSLLSDAQGQRC